MTSETPAAAAADPATTPGASLPPASPPRGWLRSVWNAVSAAVGVVMGLAPHVLHHVGVFAGAFFVAGVTGSLLFGAAGLLLTVPLLYRLFHRFGTWKAPAIAVTAFTVMFALSTFVLGPALTGATTGSGGSDGSDPGTPSPASSTDPDHDAHHP
jgi:hypothetical protein